MPLPGDGARGLGATEQVAGAQPIGLRITQKTKALSERADFFSCDRESDTVKKSLTESWWELVSRHASLGLSFIGLRLLKNSCQ